MGLISRVSSRTYREEKSKMFLSKVRANLVKFSLDKTTHVGTLTLNNPSKLNALTAEMGDEFTSVLKNEISHLPPSELRAVILTGEGKGFSAGGDLDWLMQRHQDKPHNNTIIMREFYKKFLNIRNYCPVPTIAAINGPAIGAGFALACACDLRLAAPKARMGVTFVGLGLSPGMGSTHWLSSIVGPQKANELLFTGGTITGEEAAAAGFVLKSSESVVEESVSLANKIAQQAPLAVRAAVRATRISQESFGGGLEAALRREADAQGNIYGSEDLKEGVLALQERRKAKFTGN